VSERLSLKKTSAMQSSQFKKSAPGDNRLKAGRFERRERSKTFSRESRTDFPVREALARDAIDLTTLPRRSSRCCRLVTCDAARQPRRNRAFSSPTHESWILSEAQAQAQVRLRNRVQEVNS
jgi:hypothetical protein